MKVLYAIQGTGNGHVARAREVIPILQKYCDVDILLAGNQSEITLPVTPKYTWRGLTFYYSKTGGIDHFKTVFSNNLLRWFKEVKSTPVEDYDLILNDFECVSAYAAKKKGVPIVSLSHQCSLLGENAPKPQKPSRIGEWILRHYAPAENRVGFNFVAHDPFVHTPVIRKEIRALSFEDLGHITVYLPAYSNQILAKTFAPFTDYTFQVFSKNSNKIEVLENCTFYPADSRTYVESFRTCSGLITGAGFEAPSEALFAGKKLIAIPIKDQYEQECNAQALSELGVWVYADLNSFSPLRKWLDSPSVEPVIFKDETEEIIKNIIKSATT